MAKDFNGFIEFIRNDEGFKARFDSSYDRIVRKVEEADDAVSAFDVSVMVARNEMLLLLEAYHEWLGA